MKKGGREGHEEEEVEEKEKEEEEEGEEEKNEISGCRVAFWGFQEVVGMPPSVKYLRAKHEDPSLDAQHPRKSHLVQWCISG